MLCWLARGLWAAAIATMLDLASGVLDGVSISREEDGAVDWLPTRRAAT
jgi:hypothetical protein